MPKAFFMPVAELLAFLGATACLISSPVYASLLRFAFWCTVGATVAALLAVWRNEPGRAIGLVVLVPVLAWNAYNLVSRSTAWL